MTIVKLLAEQRERFNKAKEELEAARVKPPDTKLPLKLTKETLQRFKSRIADLEKEKRAAVKAFDLKIKTGQAEIKRLEKELKQQTDDRKRKRTVTRRKTKQTASKKTSKS